MSHKARGRLVIGRIVQESALRVRVVPVDASVASYVLPARAVHVCGRVVSVVRNADAR